MDTVDVELRPPRHRVARRARTYWATRALVGWVIALLVVVVGGLVVLGLPDAVVIVIAVVGVMAGVAHLLVMPRWRFAWHRWEATEHAVYTQSGWFDQERRIAPVSRIQTVDSEQGPLERLFRLANVTVTTASAAGPLKIEGLDAGQARALVDDLTAVAEGTPGDAT